MANRTFADYAASLPSGTLDSVIGLDGSTVKTGEPGSAAVTVSPQTGNFTANGASGTVFTNAGSAGDITATLVNSDIGSQYTFLCVTADQLFVSPPTGHTIYFVDSGGTNQEGTDTNLLTIGGAGAGTSIVKTSATAWVSVAGAAMYATS